MTLLYGLFVGIGMGILLQRAGASSPGTIARTLRLENLGVIKFMATTIAVGTVGVHGLAALGVPMHFDIKPIYVVGVLAGGLILGVGFALGGYCPGTCVVGAGEGRRDAVWAIVGALAGALAFTFVYSWLRAPLIEPLDYGKMTLASALQFPPILVAAALSAIILTVVTLLPTERPISKRDSPSQ